MCGMESLVAYELTDGKGQPLNDTITVYENGTPLLTSAPKLFGKGAFRFTPKTDATYHATVMSEKKTLKFTLPDIADRGVTVSVGRNNGAMEIAIRNNIDEEMPLGCAILNKNRLQTYKTFASTEKEMILRIAPDSLAEGVNRVVVFSNGDTPLAERQFFVRHDKLMDGDVRTKRLKATVESNGEFAAGEEITVKIECETGEGIPEDTELSVAVYDADTHEKSFYTHNIYTYLLLGSELKGFIPDATRYFDADNSDRDNELELIMLTHGWTAYDWSRLAGNSWSMEQPAEKGITLRGEAMNIHKYINNRGNRSWYTISPNAGNSVLLSVYETGI